MVELTIDGHKVEMPEGSMVMHAVEKLSQYVPHFCYHKKLSIAANCRMCLVEVEKAPKPLPACATPVSQGMIVHTASAKAKAAQEGVMEFLLINHPLDCPICDQGGECQLQDLAVGYGKSESRYEEDKRVVETKDAGALISMEEMSRCIHCTRCVRFGQEVAGVMELGMLGRGEHAEITTFLGKGIDSELSGNMIDLCPVGALTSKPFRYQARTWELSRRKGVSVHDSLGSNLTVQVKAGKVMRVLPLENEAINECWISDRDRFAYEGLNSEDRLTQPMIKRNGAWEVASWDLALAQASNILKTPGTQSAALAHAMSSLEELNGLKTLLAGLGSNNVAFNLRATDPTLDANRLGAPWLGMPIAEVSHLDRALVIGSFLRKDQPLLATRLRAATKRGAQVMVVHASDDDLLMAVKAKIIAKPSALVDAVAQIAAAVATIKGALAPLAATPTEAATAIANSLCSGEKKAVWLGQLALNHAQASSITALAQFISTHSGATLGTLVQEANAVGAYALGLNSSAVPVNVLYNVEPSLDCGALPAMASQVIAFTAFRSAVESFATVMLPITPATEAGGTFISLEGRTQTMNPSVKPLGESKPGWKVLKVLGEALGLNGFAYETLEEAKTQALHAAGDVSAKLNNSSTCSVKAGFASKALERVADVPAYASDAIVRRADSLQRTAEGTAPTARMHSMTLASLGLHDGQSVKVQSSAGSVVLKAQRDDSAPSQSVRLSAARSETAPLGNALALTVEAA
jgi:NADH-quinone oxidoreductase subunit G